jgi:hypothetical protein
MPDTLRGLSAESGTAYKRSCESWNGDAHSAGNRTAIRGTCSHVINPAAPLMHFIFRMLGGPTYISTRIRVRNKARHLAVTGQRKLHLSAADDDVPLSILLN